MYNFGQFRRSQVKEEDGFITDIIYNIASLDTPSPLIGELYFEDKKLILNNGQGFDSESTSYYLRFSIAKKENTEQEITVKMFNSHKDEDNEQTIETVKIDKGSEDEYVTFEIVLSPNNLYNEIHFILTRTMDDYQNEARIINLRIDKFGTINNIITQLSSAIHGKSILKQIGIQSAPGLGMCINGEMIRVGRSGLYEIRNGVEIYFIGFLIDSNSSENNKYFLLDYQY